MSGSARAAAACPVIEIGAGPKDREGRRVGDRLMACAQTPEDAERIVAALNATEST